MRLTMAQLGERWQQDDVAIQLPFPYPICSVFVVVVRACFFIALFASALSL